MTTLDAARKLARLIACEPGWSADEPRETPADGVAEASLVVRHGRERYELAIARMPPQRRARPSARTRKERSR